MHTYKGATDAVWVLALLASLQSQVRAGAIGAPEADNAAAAAAAADVNPSNACGMRYDTCYTPPPVPACPSGQQMDTVQDDGDNGSCDCESFCAADWSGSIKIKRPHWTGATTAIPGSSVNCVCIQADHWCPKAAGCGNSCDVVGKPQPSNYCIPQIMPTHLLQSTALQLDQYMSSPCGHLVGVDTVDTSSCECAAALAKACPQAQHNGATCNACVKKATLPEACTALESVRIGYCADKCAADSYTWIGEQFNTATSSASPLLIMTGPDCHSETWQACTASQPCTVNMKDDMKAGTMVSLCKGATKADHQGCKITPTDVAKIFSASDLAVLNTFNCDAEVMYGFMDSSPNFVLKETQFFADVHDTKPTIMKVIASACQNAASGGNSTGIFTKAFLKILRTATDGCKQAAIDAWFNVIGLKDETVDSSKAMGGAAWIIDMIRMPVALKVDSLKNLLGTEMLELNAHWSVGRALAGAKRNGCDDAWFMPPIDKMVTTVYQIQADFLLEGSNTAEGACAYAQDSYLHREQACTQVLAKMLAGYFAGDQLLFCMVDCQELDGAEGGVLVSIGASVQEVSIVKANGTVAPPTQSQSQDFAKLIMKDGGMIIRKSATDHGVTAQAFAATARPLITYDMMDHAVWSDARYCTPVDELDDVISKLSWDDVAPNMTGAADRFSRFPGFPETTTTTTETTTTTTTTTPSAKPNPSSKTTTTGTTMTVAPKPSQQSLTTTETALIGVGGAILLIAISLLALKKRKASGSQESAGNSKPFSRLQDGSYEGDEANPHNEDAANTKRTSSWA